MHSIRFPVKGCFYYAAAEALQTNFIAPQQAVTLKLEPNNAYDKNAVQIWLPLCSLLTTNQTPSSHSSSTPLKQGFLLGYVPRMLARQVTQRLEQQQVVACKIVHSAHRGKHIELDCQLDFQAHLAQTMVLRILCFWVSSWHQLKRFYGHLTA